MTNLAEPATRQALAHRIAALRPELAPRWGRMSPHQALCHLTDSFLGCMGERAISPATGLLQRTFMKWFALNVPMHWPKGVPTRPEVDQFGGGTPPEDFGHDRDRLIACIERFCAAEAKRSPHPIFGEMREDEWMRWGYLHVDHHLRQFGV